jgi:predicted TIM-barrel fold metal-dependent hydrolase
VFMECRAMYRRDGDPDFAPVGETEFVNGIAAMSASGHYGSVRVCEGIVGHANLRLGARAGRVLEALIAAGGGRFRGIRHSSPWHVDPEARGSAVTAEPGMLTSTAFREGFACLKPLGLSFDAWMYHTQLSELVDLARRFPDTPIVTCHIGGAINIGPYAGKRQEAFAEWRKAVFAYDQLVKPPSSETVAADWRPYIETCIELFGPQRCMFESNFPVDKASCSYAVMWNAFKRITKDCSDADKAALYRTNAARFYRLKPEA